MFVGGATLVANKILTLVATQAAWELETKEIQDEGREQNVNRILTSKGEAAKAEIRQEFAKIKLSAQYHVVPFFTRLPNPATDSGKTENLDIDSLKTHHAGEQHDLRLGPLLESFGAK